MDSPLASATGTINAKKLMKGTFGEKQPIFWIKGEIKEYCHNGQYPQS